MSPRRDRELAIAPPRLPGTRGVVLADSERMPAPAAVDMVVLTLATEQRTGPVIDRELARIAQRLAAAAKKEPGTTALVRTVLRALAGIGPSGGLSGSAAQTAAQLVNILVDHGSDDDATWLTEQLLDAPDQLSSAIAHDVLRLMRTPGRAEPVIAAGKAWLQQTGLTWRENHAVTGRDTFFSGLAVQLAERGDFDAALAVAMKWPPMRTPLTRLVEVLCAAGVTARLADLARRYDPEGLLHRALVKALSAAVDKPGPAESDAAQTLFAIAPTLENAAKVPATAADPQAGERTFALIDNTLSQRDAPDTIAHIPDGPDGDAALLGLVERFPDRGRTMKAIMRRLERRDPIAGFEARAVWLTATVKMWPGSVSATRLRSMLNGLRAAATKAGEPALAELLIETLRANHDEPALLTLLR